MPVSVPNILRLAKPRHLPLVPLKDLVKPKLWITWVSSV